MGKIKWAIITIGVIINIISRTWGWKVISLMMIIIVMWMGEMFNMSKKRRGKFGAMKYGK